MPFNDIRAVAQKSPKYMLTCASLMGVGRVQALLVFLNHMAVISDVDILVLNQFQIRRLASHIYAIRPCCSGGSAAAPPGESLVELEKVTDALAASTLAPREGQPSSAACPASGSQTPDPDPPGDEESGIVFAEEVKNFTYVLTQGGWQRFFVASKRFVFKNHMA